MAETLQEILNDVADEVSPSTLDRLEDRLTALLQAERLRASSAGVGVGVENQLRYALREVIHEATRLSPVEDDGSHWCKISGKTLAQARAAVGVNVGVNV